MRKLCCLLHVFFVVTLATADVWKEDFDNGMPKGWETIKGKWKVDKKVLTEIRSETSQNNAREK